jgi:DNA polymerase-1
MRDDLSNIGFAGLDTEFTGLDYWSPDWRLKSVQIGDENGHVYYLDMSDPWEEDVAREALMSIPQFVSHGEADCLAIYRHFGIDITERNWDTHTMASLLWPHKATQRDLKTLVGTYVGHGLQELQGELYAVFRELLGKRPEHKLTEKQIGEGFALIDPLHPAFIAYASADARDVRKLFCVLEPKLYEFNVHTAWEKECKIRAMATRMQMRGMLTSRELIQTLLMEWGGRLSSAQSEWEKTYDCVPGSPKRADVLLQSGVSLSKKTKPTDKFPEGQWSLPQKELEELAESYPDNEPLQLQLTISENKNVATFLTTLLGFVDTHGLAHPFINTLGAETGRWTVKQPAVQTLQETCRTVFIPDPGNVLVSFDLGQIEPRVAVGLSGEKNLIPSLLAGLDCYAAGATAVFGKAFSAKQRKYIKRVILGEMFGAGIPTLVYQAKYMDGWLDVTPGAISKVRDQWTYATPTLHEWGRELQSLPRIDLESGRYVPRDMAKSYRAINSSCQGNARDVLMDRALEVSQRYDTMIWHTMHDELILNVPKDRLKEVIDFVKPIMEQGFLGIPTPVDIEIFPEHWSAKGPTYEEYING